MEIIRNLEPKKAEYLNCIPDAPNFLSQNAKKHYKLMAEKLIDVNRLKIVYLDALTIFAEAMAQFEWATKEINRKNKEDFGTGYMQTYKSKATNISTEVVLRNDAEATLFKCFKQFGLDPKSDQDLKNNIDPNQTSLFDQFLNQKQG